MAVWCDVCGTVSVKVQGVQVFPLQCFVRAFKGLGLTGVVFEIIPQMLHLLVNVVIFTFMSEPPFATNVVFFHQQSVETSLAVQI